MTRTDRSATLKISAVVSDVDGTLVTEEKLLTEPTKAAVKALHARGIIFSIISSRPPRGLRMLIEALEIAVPFGGLNSGVIAAPDFSMIREHLLLRSVAQRTVNMLTAIGAQSWLFAGKDWMIRDADGPYVALEQRTVAFPPTVVEDFAPFLDHTGKIVGVSPDFDRLAQCEKQVLHLCDVVLVMTVNPGFSGQAFLPEMLPKIRDLRRLCASMGLDPWIEVDGGQKGEHAASAIAAGANAIVAGSAIFGSRDYAAAIARLRHGAVQTRVLA